jgi:hypothetical protein
MVVAGEAKAESIRSERVGTGYWHLLQIHGFFSISRSYVFMSALAIYELHATGTVFLSRYLIEPCEEVRNLELHKYDYSATVYENKFTVTSYCIL